MTREPVKRPTPDLARFVADVRADQQARDEKLDKLIDGVGRIDAKVDARQKVSAENDAVMTARMDAIQAEQERTSRRLSEVIASGMETFRKLDKKIDATTTRVDDLVERAAAEVKPAAEEAAGMAVESVVHRVDPGVHKAVGFGRMSVGIGQKNMRIGWLAVAGGGLAALKAWWPEIVEGFKWLGYGGKAIAAIFAGKLGIGPPP